MIYLLCLRSMVFRFFESGGGGICLIVLFNIWYTFVGFKLFSIGRTGEKETNGRCSYDSF